MSILALLATNLDTSGLPLLRLISPIEAVGSACRTFFAVVSSEVVN